MGKQELEEIGIHMAFIISFTDCNYILNSEISPVTPIYTMPLLMLYQQLQRS